MHVLATGKGDEVFETAQSLGEQLDAAGLDVLVDDRRKVSAGVKFKDYELVGVPFGLVAVVRWPTARWRSACAPPARPSSYPSRKPLRACASFTLRP